MNRYGREDVLRILRLPSRQLASWQKAGLVSVSEEFSFEQLVQLRKLRDLTATRITVRSIQRSVDAMQKVSGMTNPLLESVAVMTRHRPRLPPVGRARRPGHSSDGIRLGTRSVRRHEGRPPRPAGSPSSQRSAGHVPPRRPPRRKLRNPARSQECCTRSSSSFIPRMPPPPSISAPSTTTSATTPAPKPSIAAPPKSDPEYALAFFDLGNVLDELAAPPRSYRRLRARTRPRAAIRRRPLQSRSRLRAHQRAPQSAASLDAVRPPRPHRPLGQPRPLTSQKDPRL